MSHRFSQTEMLRWAFFWMTPFTLYGCNSAPSGGDGSNNSGDSGAGRLTGAAAVCWSQSETVENSGEPCSLAWRGETDLLLSGPVTYELASDGSLTKAHMIFDQEFISAFFNRLMGVELDDDEVEDELCSDLVLEEIAEENESEADETEREPDEDEEDSGSLNCSEDSFDRARQDDVEMMNAEFSPRVLTDEVLADISTPVFGIPGYYDPTSLETIGSLRYRLFSVLFLPDGIVEWNFEVEFLLEYEGGPVGSTIIEGTIHGVLSGDGETIRWTTVQGTTNLFSVASVVEPIDLQELLGNGTADNPIGTWTLVSRPEPRSDSDGDGVKDEFDPCPQTTSESDVDLLGCGPDQKDVDEDGVVDTMDFCAFTTEEAEVNDNGCAPDQIDTDNDGTFDPEDQCSDTPTDELADEFGCTVVPPGPVAQVWSSDLPLQWSGILFSSLSYELTAGGQFVQARFVIEHENEDDDTNVFEPLAESIPLNVTTDLIRESYSDLEFLQQARVDAFLVTFNDDGTVEWEFDIVTISLPPVQFIYVRPTEDHYQGIQTGTLSDDGRTITWTALSGTLTESGATDENGMFEPDNVTDLTEEFGGAPLGSWTLME